MAQSHTISPYHCWRGVVHLTVPRPRHWPPVLKTPTPTPPGQPIARYFPPVTQTPPPPTPHWSSLMEGRLGGWDHTRGEGAQEVERGFCYINPRATVVTPSLAQNHHGPWQSLTCTATSQLDMKKSFAAKKVQVFQQMGKHSRTIRCLFQSGDDLNSTVN